MTRNGNVTCVDDVSSEVLDEAGVRAARKLEMDYFHTMGVYSYATREKQLVAAQARAFGVHGLMSRRETAATRIIDFDS